MHHSILFTEEELQDLLNGGETRHVIDEPGEVFFMSVETYAERLMSGFREES